MLGRVIIFYLILCGMSSVLFDLAVRELTVRSPQQKSKSPGVTSLLLAILNVTFYIQQSTRLEHLLLPQPVVV